MVILQGTDRCYIVLLLCLYSMMLTTIQGLEKPTAPTSAEENNPGFTNYFLYQYPDFPRDCSDIRNQCSTSEEYLSGTYLIKPEGYMEPFEVYCNNDVEAGGWTVVLRRQDGSLNFKRNWEDFKLGFGFLSNEHWLGNDKLSYLTNQAEYELRIDYVLSNGSLFYVKYGSFRITDEWSQYALFSSGTYSGNGSLAVSDCPPNMTDGNLACQLTCDDPSGSKGCSASKSAEVGVCVCDDGFLMKGDNCVVPDACGCFLAEVNTVLPNNETYVNEACSRKCICQNDQLYCTSNYECSLNAACKIKDNVRQCYCNDGYEGDGETCIPLYKDCYDVHQAGFTENGVYTIAPTDWPGSPFDVYCDMTTSGGGWTVFQRRVDRITDFYRNWTSYKNGFGSVQHGRDFWLGNEKLYYLTNTNEKSYKLRVDIVTSDGSPKYDEYTSFRIESEDTKYRLVDIGSHSGTAANGMYYTSGVPFSTFDDDNDACENHNCAEKHRAAWWHNPNPYGYCNPCYGSHCYHFRYSSSCQTRCSPANLNGDYNGGNGEFLFWGRTSSYCNLISAEMKIRPSV